MICYKKGAYMKHYMSKNLTKYLIESENEKERKLIDSIYAIVILVTDSGTPAPLPPLKGTEYCHSCGEKQIRIPE